MGYIPPNANDREESNCGEVVPAEWRNESTNMREIGRVSSNMASRQAAAARDTFKEYFLTTTGKVPWQENVVRRGKRK